MLEIARRLALGLVDDGVRLVDRELFGGRLEVLDQLVERIKKKEDDGYELVVQYGSKNCGECDQPLLVISLPVWTLLDGLEIE